MTLTDQVKRSFHDKKRKSVFATSAPSQKKRRQTPKKTDAKKVNKENIPDFSKRPVPVRGEAPYTWSGSGTQTQKFPPSQQAHVTNEKQKYHSVPGWQNPVTGHQTHATHQQQQSRNVPGQHTPVESQKLQSDAQSKNTATSQAASDSNKNGTADGSFTARAGTCNSKKVSTAAFNQQSGAVRTESPISSSRKSSRQSQNVPDHQIPVATQQKQCEKPPFGAGSKILKRSSKKENNAVSKGDLAGCTNGSDNPTYSPVTRKISKGYSSCNAGKSGETINVASNGYSEQRSSIPKTDKTTNENGEVVNGSDHNVKEGIRKEDEMPNAAGNGATRSADVSIPFEGVSYPDPEFYDFEKERDADRFKVDQIWAVYDDYNSMPRYYAKIKEVYSPNFMLQFTWLEFDPQNDAQKAWSSEELPAACGSFRIGKTKLTEDKNMFSHVVSWAKGRKRNSFEIYPRKGEVWAIFKRWHINWSANDHQLCSYDIVEVQSEFVAGTGTYVIPLVKLKGFVSLFVRSDSKEPCLIPDGDTLKFSHSIPFHMLAEADVQGIPHSALELDPGSLPSDMEEEFSSVDLGSGLFSNRGGKTGGNVSSTTEPSSGEVPVGKTKHDLRGASADGWDDSCQPKSPTSFVYPEPEICNFSLIRSFENFKNGQIWALYCDADKFPKYYGFIKKVDPERCTIHIRWLEYCPCLETEKSLMQEGHPVSCGTFKVSKQSDSYDCTSVFSHIVEVVTIGKGKKYDIVPCAGQVWAVYKNWSCDWSFKNYKICEYDFVEVLKTSDTSIIVYYLTKVEGFSSVFMPQEKGGSRRAMKIQRSAGSLKLPVAYSGRRRLQPGPKGGG
jgi:hypothetical protein